MNLLPSTTQTAMAELEALMPLDRHKSSSSMVFDEEVKYVKWDIADDVDEIYLIQITDVQWGNRSCNVKRVIEFRDWVLAAPNRYMFFGGDMVDAGTLLSVGSPFDQTGEPRRQIMEAVKVWAPARDRILGFVGGNHERRGIPTYGDLGLLLATLLRVPYSRGQQFIDIHFGGHKPFKVSLWHGKGSASTKGAIAQSLQRFALQGDSQLYLMGHLHQPLIMPFWKTYRRGGQMRMEKVVAAMGSSFLETFGSYGEIAGFAAHDILMPCAVLERSGKWEVRLR